MALYADLEQFVQAHRPHGELTWSTLLSRNAPLLYVQQQGGWWSASVLLRVYARWMPQDGLGTTAVPLPDATPAQPATILAAAATALDAR